jgi:hypothetical protein
MLVDTDELASKRAMFFRIVFGDDNEAFICLSRRDPTQGLWEEEFFKWPGDKVAMSEWVTQNIVGYDLYYCAQLLSRPDRHKEWVGACTCAWADLDTCPPDVMLVKPSVTIESSPGRYQALWLFSDTVDPAQAEDISRRIAYYHQDDGCDITGWGLSKNLRVPWTTNYKYATSTSVELPIVNVISSASGRYEVTDFDVYPQVKGYEYTDIPFPEPDALEELEASLILEKYRNRILPTAWHLFQSPPDSDWSKSLWQLQMILFEGGLTREEVYVVCEASACNKYKRDNKATTLLWKEVCRAFSMYEEQHTYVATKATDTPLLTDEERRWCETDRTIVEEYIEWARNLGDAAWQYHQAGAFVTLSSLLAGNVRLPTSFGVVVPNLWFMILADTTLTRKTTAMDVAMDLVAELDSDAVLATDGSIEGLFTSLSMRPGRPSVFLRDEFSGLLEAITKKDYYAGMAETLTKLYDGKFQKRVLRKDIIEVRDPVLIMFAGGIRERVLSLLTYEHVASGFLPRFVFITAESDLTRMRPLGPPTVASTAERDRLLAQFNSLSNHYKQIATIHVNGRTIEAAKAYNASLTEDAWHRYNQFESALLNTGLRSFHSDVLTPSFDRLAKSGLKVAVLVAATRNLSDRVVVEERDIVRAFHYVEQWQGYTLDVLNNIGRTTAERQIELIRGAIMRNEGVLRSELMQKYHLSARDTDQILMTLDQRGQITRHKSGRTERLYPIHA